MPKPLSNHRFCHIMAMFLIMVLIMFNEDPPYLGSDQRRLLLKRTSEKRSSMTPPDLPRCIRTATPSAKITIVIICHLMPPAISVKESDQKLWFGQLSKWTPPAKHFPWWYLDKSYELANLRSLGDNYKFQWHSSDIVTCRDLTWPNFSRLIHPFRWLAPHCSWFAMSSHFGPLKYCFCS